MYYMANQNIDKKDIAKSLYLNGSFTQEEIAEKVGTTRQTVSRWVKQGAWDELKASLTITPAQILAGLNRQIVEINNNINQREEGKRFATVPEADTLAKLASAIKKIEQDVGIADIVDVGIRFTNWLRPLDLDMAKKFSQLLDAFIKEQMK
jgi:transcriptional regulator with XRE-family HTH domain